MMAAIFRLLCLASIGSLALARTTPATTTGVCADPVDIVIVVDASQSIGFEQFQTLKTTLEGFGDQLGLSDQGVKVGMVLYSTTVDEAQTIPLTGNANLLRSRIRSWTYLEGGTFTNLGIDRASQLLQNAGRSAPRIMVVLTDGESDKPSLTKQAATNAKAQQITMYAVAVGAAVKQSELEDIASGPSNIIKAASFSVLVQSLKTLTQSICATPAASVSGLCNNCKWRNGNGYNSHPDSCRKFIKCVKIDDVLVPMTMDCPDRLFWNQDLMNCVEFLNSDCNKGQCDGTSSYLFHSVNDCAVYFNCTNGVTSQHCCDPRTPKFDEVSKSCVSSTNCTACATNLAPCQDSINKPYIENGAIDRCFYNVTLGTVTYKMMCAAGTAFNGTTCNCQATDKDCSVPVARADVCNPDFHMPFDNDLKKDLINNAWIDQIGVVISDGAAKFADTGNEERLFIARYSNNDLTLPFVAKVVFRETANKANMAVLSSGGCTDKPSVYITVGNGQVTLGVVTVGQGYDAPLTTSMSSATGWKEVKLMYDGRKLTGTITRLNDNLNAVGTAAAFPEVVNSGNGEDKILKVSGPLQLGYAHNNFPGLIGFVTELKLWQGCKEQLTLDQYS